ncbi:hypothetical protein [Pedobacter aquatilis]|uniref:hypothetical protein n=1 Tax=Pedobacter aquatilis TaxID=351343 RepID=UPI002930112E|nr:hypothetical protein [Pedobacter aquatilis]
MRSLKKLLILLGFLNAGIVYAQDSLLTNLAKQNLKTFEKTEKGFKGPGWDEILDKAKKSNYVAIGEDHFTNEIPYFFSAIIDQIKFDNFFCEIDPYSAQIIQDKINLLSPGDLRNYVNEFGNTFSFYAFQAEFDLLKKLSKNHTKIQGTDQILLVADRLVCSELKKITKNEKARKIYETIEINSKTYFANFLKNQAKGFYMYTPEFEKNLNELQVLALSKKEQQLISNLKLTAKIYKSQDHHLRVQLMKNQLMNNYSNWVNKKNLFKYGANHMAKGESLLEIYDTGNLVNNIADSRFEKSVHIMVIGKSGFQASPFKGFDAEKVDENSGSLKTLKPFFKMVNGNAWHCFDLKSIQEAISDGKIKINDIKLLRIIKGFDMIVVIPSVTASTFIVD